MGQLILHRAGGGPGLNRRSLLIGGGAAAGLLLAWELWPRHYVPNLATSGTETPINAFLKIDSTGQIITIMPQLEMGQGVSTLLPQILADELGADWRRVAVEPAPLSPHYANTVLAARWAELWMPALPGLSADPDGAVTRRLAEDMAFGVTVLRGTIGSC